nr:hypothetical protein [Tanacetum cinerariifolium]
MRLKTDIKPKEATFQVVLDALALTPFYCAFLITVDVPAIYMQEFYATFCSKLPGQQFEDLPLKHDILSFIRDLGHSGDIIYLSDVNVDYLHQPWRAFSTIINKCLSGKETGMDKIQKTPKPKYVRKKADLDTSPKQKPVQATKAKVAKSNKKKQPTKMQKAKRLDVFSKVALTEPKQLKLATKRRKKDFRISHASGSSDGVDTQSKVPNEQQQKTSDTDEGTDSDEEDDDEDEFKDDVDNNDDDSNDNVESDDERTVADRDEIPDPNKTNEEHDEEAEEYDDKFTIKEDEKMDEEEDDEVTKELYKDVNVNLGNKDADITNAGQGGADQQNAFQQSGFKQEEKDTHVTLTPVLDTQKTRGPTQSSSVSSYFTSKLLNLDNPSPADNDIASLMDTTAHHATTIPKITLSFTTTIHPPPSLFNPLSQQATPTLIQQLQRLQHYFLHFQILLMYSNSMIESPI